VMALTQHAKMLVAVQLACNVAYAWTVALHVDVAVNTGKLSALSTCVQCDALVEQEQLPLTANGPPSRCCCCCCSSGCACSALPVGLSCSRATASAAPATALLPSLLAPPAAVSPAESVAAAAAAAGNAGVVLSSAGDSDVAVGSVAGPSPGVGGMLLVLEPGVGDVLSMAGVGGMLQAAHSTQQHGIVLCCDCVSAYMCNVCCIRG
jgi:hypothetical protein